MIDLSLVIPVYNGEKIIGPLVESCIERFNRTGFRYEIILVDDGSDDASADEIRRRLSENVRMVTLPRNRGKGCAVRRGILESRGANVFYTDSDLAYGLDVVLDMTESLENGADLVLGSRKLAVDGYGDYPMIRTVASHIYSGIITVFSGVAYDTQCGIKGFRRESALKIFDRVRTDGYAFDLEVILLAEREHMKIVEHPVMIINQGESSVNVLSSSISMLRDMRRIKKRIRSMEDKEPEHKWSRKDDH